MGGNTFTSNFSSPGFDVSDLKWDSLLLLVVAQRYSLQNLVQLFCTAFNFSFNYSS